MTNLTIIIPHYNTPQLLKKLLDSIPVLDDIQVIVIDDNSTVETDILNTLRKTRPHVTFLTNHTEKNSAGTCRNIGLQHAKGRWILFADADDSFADGFYDIVSEYFESEHDIVFFSPTSVDLNTGNVSNRHIILENLIEKYLDNSSKKNALHLMYSFPVPWSKLVSKKCVISNDISFEEIPVANDMMFFIKLGYYAKNIAADKRTIYTVVLKKESITTIIDDERIFIRLHATIRRYNFLRENLSKKDFRILDYALGNTVLAALWNGYPITTVWKIIALIRKNKVRFFRRRYLNPKYIYNELKMHSKKHEKKYYAYTRK